MASRVTGLLLTFVMCAVVWAEGDDGLVAHWDFDEGKGDVLHDRSGNENHGKIHGARWLKGSFGHALEFDGKDDHVECPYSKANDTPDAFTVEAWAYQRRTGGGIFCRVKGGGWADQRLTLTTFYRKNKDPYFLFCISDGKKCNPTTRPALELNTWTHLAASFDGKAVRVYRNAKLEKSYVSGCKANVENIPIWIGRSVGIGDRPYFSGMIRDVRYYSRALSAAEIKGHYKSAPHMKGDAVPVEKKAPAPPAEAKQKPVTGAGDE